MKPNEKSHVSTQIAENYMRGSLRLAAAGRRTLAVCSTREG